MAVQQDTHPPVFTILNHPWIVMKGDYQDPPAGNAGVSMARTSCRQHRSCSHSIAVLRQSPHSAQAFTTSGTQ